jgi:hypothetical protein
VAIEDRSISPWGFVGLIGVVAAFFPYAASGLVAPYWAVGVLLVIWLVMFVVTCRWFMPHPRRTVVMAVVAFVFWYAAVTAGAFFLDWSA